MESPIASPKLLRAEIKVFLYVMFVSDDEIIHVFPISPGRADKKSEDL